MKVVAVIPAYNEGSRIREAVRDARQYVDAVVVVDDCSRDETGVTAFEEGAYTLRHVVNRGQGAALQTGADFAVANLQADVVVHFDGDGQMQGADIPAMVAQLAEQGVDVVLGSRFLGKESDMPMTRRVTLKAALVFTRVVSGISISDPHCGFRVLSRRACGAIRFRQDRMAHASEVHDLIKSHKLAYASFPVSIRYTQETLKKGMSFWNGFTVLKDYFKHKFF